MASNPTTCEDVVERLRSLHVSIKSGIRSGKIESGATAALTEAVTLLTTHSATPDAAAAGLRCLDDVLTAAPSTVTLIRLEGGVSLLPRILRCYQTDASILALAARIARQICTTSSVAAALFSKDKAFVTSLLTTCRMHTKNMAVVAPLVDCMVVLAKHSKGACALCCTSLTEAFQPLIHSTMGWDLLGAVLRVLKNVAKQDAERMMATCGTQATELLVRAAKLLSEGQGKAKAPAGQVPASQALAQTKLLKRACRTVWLLHAHELFPLPDMEAAWPLPHKDTPHLLIPAASDGDAQRVQELFPDESAVMPVVCPEDLKPAQMVRPAAPPSLAPASAAALTQLALSTSGGPDPFHDEVNTTSQCAMMMHDLQRLLQKTRPVNNCVFCNTTDPSAESSSDKSATGGRNSSSHPLTFESRFEGGNLRAAVQVNAEEYDLFLSPDLNDRSAYGNLVQWFHFAVSGAVPGVAYKFNLINFSKKSSLFGCGKRPIVCRASSPSGAEEGARSAGDGCAFEPSPPSWQRSGTNIAYYPSPYRGRGAGAAEGSGKKTKKAAGSGKKSVKQGAKAASKAEAAAERPPNCGPGLYCCTFTLTFDSSHTYYVASCYPYSYTEMQAHLQQLCSQSGEGGATGAAGSASSVGVRPVPGPIGTSLVARSLLCYTLAGQRCDLLTITDLSAPPDVIRQRECIMLTARVHPGETCASWIMQGFLDFLMSSEPAAQTLRSSFVFKIVPMLNPDGVVNGNYRCSLTGTDLNRVWDKPTRALHPTIFHAKKVLQSLAAAGRLALFIDIHGHSNKEDVFFYGCEPNLAGIKDSASAKDMRKPGSGARGAEATSSGTTGDADATIGTSGTDGGNGCAVLQPSPAQPGTSASSSAAPAWSAAAGGEDVAGAGRATLTARVAARLRVRMLPYLASKISPDFSLPRSQFRVRKAKLSAARVVVNRELGVAGSYTLEASLGGRSASRCHFTIQDYLQLGHKLCRAIAELAEVDDAVLLEDMSANVQLPAAASGNAP